jgi:putative SOS response-associated peptidase YedK
MCGRYVSTGSLADLSVLLGVNPFSADETGGALRPAFNVAPTDTVPAVLPADPGKPEERELALLTWGLVPPWSEPATGAQRINARAETVLEKPAFRRAIRSRRCLLPADGWYEWVREPAGKARRAPAPYLIRPADGSLLTFAGLYERWHAPDGSTLLTSAILTGPAPGPLAWLHERAPILVPPELWSSWLDPTVPAEELLAAVRNAPPRRMTVHPVSSAVNSVRNTGPELIEPTGDPVEGAPPVQAAQAALW